MQRDEVMACVAGKPAYEQSAMLYAARKEMEGKEKGEKEKQELQEEEAEEKAQQVPRSWYTAPQHAQVSEPASSTQPQRGYVAPRRVASPDRYSASFGSASVLTPYPVEKYDDKSYPYHAPPLKPREEARGQLCHTASPRRKPLPVSSHPLRVGSMRDLDSGLVEGKVETAGGKMFETTMREVEDAEMTKANRSGTIREMKSGVRAEGRITRDHGRKQVEANGDGFEDVDLR